MVALFAIIFLGAVYLSFQIWIPCNESLTPYYTLSTIQEEVLEMPYIPFLTPQNYTNWSAQRKFDIDDTNRLNSLRDSVSCIPAIWGYSKEEGLEVFPEYNYPRCQNVKPYIGTVKLDTESNLVQMKCESFGPERRYYYITGDQSMPKLFNLTDFTDKVKFTPKNAIFVSNDTDFVLAGCDRNKELSMLDVRPRFQHETYQNAVKKLEKLPQSNNNVAIIHLTVDSFSRRHFFRKMPITLKLLNDLNAMGQFATFDYKIHNINGKGSIENQVISISGVKKELRRQYTDYKGDIWNILKRIGYVSLLAMESCNNGFPSNLSKNITVDHSLTRLYCSLEKFTRYTYQKSKKLKQRCIGQQMSHFYAFNYTTQFLDIYKGVNRYVYLHLDAAHEKTGQHAQALDFDLAYFLVSLLKRKNEKILVILEADHGMRYGDYKRGEEATYEWKLPVFFPIIQIDTISDIEGALNTLEHNSNRLTSKYDIRQTLLDFAYKMAGLQYKSQSSTGRVLYKDQAQDDYNCSRAKIPLEYCSCLPFWPIDTEVYSLEQEVTDTNFKILRSLLFKLAEWLTEYINQYIFDSNSSDLCNYLKLSEIKQAAGLVTQGNEYLRIQISVNYFMDVRYEALFEITQQRNNVNQELIVYRGHKQFFGLVSFNRVDSFSPECEANAIERKINPEYCICDSDYDPSSLLQN